MFNTGKLIKQHLLLDADITSQIGTKIYNVVVVTSDSNSIKPPYLVVEVNSMNPTYTKDLFLFNEITFSVIILAAKYDELIILSWVVRKAIEFKNIEDNTTLIESIDFDNYNESFDSSFELYTSKLTFSCRAYNK